MNYYELRVIMAQQNEEKKCWKPLLKQQKTAAGKTQVDNARKASEKIWDQLKQQMVRKPSRLKVGKYKEISTISEVFLKGTVDFCIGGVVWPKVSVSSKSVLDCKKALNLGGLKDLLKYHPQSIPSFQDWVDLKSASIVSVETNYKGSGVDVIKFCSRYDKRKFIVLPMVGYYDNRKNRLNGKYACVWDSSTTHYIRIDPHGTMTLMPATSTMSMSVFPIWRTK